MEEVYSARMFLIAISMVSVAFFPPSFWTLIS